MNATQEISQLIFLLRTTYGICFLGSGADKFLFCITDWSKQGSSCTVLRIRGMCEIAIGVLLFTKFIVPAAYTAALWLLLSGAHVFVHPQHRDTAFRYVVIALGAYVLARLTLIREIS